MTTYHEYGSRHTRRRVRLSLDPAARERVTAVLARYVARVQDGTTTTTDERTDRMGATRKHQAHEETDVCPNPDCAAPVAEWPMSHRGDVACSQRCEAVVTGAVAHEPQTGVTP